LAVAGRVVLAIAILSALAPGSAVISRWADAGEDAAHQGDYERALAAYARVLSYTGPRPPIYERLARISLDARYDDAARVYLYALADLDGWNAERRGLLGGIFEREGDTGRATALLFADQAQYNPRALWSLAQQQITRQEWTQAETTLTTLISLEPGRSQAFYQLGLLLAPKDQARAASYLERAARDPRWSAQAEAALNALPAYERSSLTDAHTYLGMTLVGLEEWAFAERALLLALAANAVNPTALAYLGLARDQQGRDGLPDIQAALAMSPNDPALYYVLGWHWRLAQDPAAAYAAFERASRLDPTNPALAVEAGAALQQQGDFAGAEDSFRRAVDLDPADIQWQRALAAFYADTGFGLDTGGLAFIEEANRLAPDDPDIRASLGWAHYQRGAYDQAYQELSAAVGLDPSRARSRYYFGVILERRGDIEGAAESYSFVVGRVGPETGFGLLAARGLQRLGYRP
jgi:tetratricopeptide (TPR) repeat protein